MSVAIEAQQVSKRFYLRHNRSHDLKIRFLAMFHERHREIVEEFWALRDVSLTIRSGEAVGVIGRNGSGKSTLLKIVAGLLMPTAGKMLVAANARIGTMIELGVGFHPELSGTENVHLNASIYGMKRPEIAALYPTHRLVRGARALHGHTAEELFIGHEGETRFCDRGKPRPGDSPPRRDLRCW